MKPHYVQRGSALQDDLPFTASRPYPLLRRIGWEILGIAVLIIGGDVFFALFATGHRVLGGLAAILIWLQAVSIFFRASRIR